jgi:transcriptional regulator with XRE-family HTH domain
VQDSLDKQFAAFLRKKRGEMSYAQFSRIVGLTKSTLFRLEQGEQSVTLRTLERVLGRLRCTIEDVF